MKKKNRLGKKLIGVLLIFSSLIIVLLLAASYLFHSRSINTLYKERVSTLAATTAEFMDGDYLQKLSDAVSSDEYQALRLEALQKDDPALLEDYLKEKDLYTQYQEYTLLLDQLLKSNNMQYLYVQNAGDGTAVDLLDPGESIFSLGAYEDLTDNIIPISSNERVDAAVTKSKYGYTCSGAEPVLSSDGSNAAVVSVVLNMNLIMNSRTRSVVYMAVFSIIILIIAAFAGGFYIQKKVSGPICDLAKDAGAFAAGDEDDLASQVVKIPEPRKDEIGDLYADIRKMQLGTIRYMNNLKYVTEEKERIGTELDIANRIQASMLPSTFPAFPNRPEFDLYALMKPAKSVAGDFYDFFLIDDDHLGIVIADVSGKGIPASLFMMMAKIIISNIAQVGDSPHNVLERANGRICRNNDENMFVTVWFGILTISTGHVIASNAGHEYPALQKEDGSYELYHDRHGFVLGGMAGVRYKDYEFDIKPGQTIFLYSDGVPDATTAENERFGSERMVEALNKRPKADPRDLVHYMLRTVDDFDGDVPQFDDITMLAIRYNGQKESLQKP